MAVQCLARTSSKRGEARYLESKQQEQRLRYNWVWSEAVTDNRGQKEHWFEDQYTVANGRVRVGRTNCRNNVKCTISNGKKLHLQRFNDFSDGSIELTFNSARRVSESIRSRQVNYLAIVNRRILSEKNESHRRKIASGAQRRLFML